MTNDQRQAAGGSAFPHPECSDKGLTIRDYFAAAALSSYITAYAAESGCVPADEDAARAAYEFADAMLKARKQD
jgi:hypothetical protein